MRVPLRVAVRVAFFGFAALLFALTHKPDFTIPIPGRPDLLAHAAAFGTWTLLLVACGFFGAPLSRRNILWCFAIASIYAAIDESSQAIPIVRRHAAVDDYLANLLGILIVICGASVQSLRTRTSRRDGPTMEPTPP